MELNCNTNHLPIDKIVSSLLRKETAPGSLIGLPIVEVDGHISPAMNCDNNHLKFEDFLKLVIGVDVCGKPALRVKIINSCEVDINCDNQIEANPLNKMFAYDAVQGTYAIVLNRSVGG